MRMLLPKNKDGSRSDWRLEMRFYNTEHEPHTVRLTFSKGDHHEGPVGEYRMKDLMTIKEDQKARIADRGVMKLEMIGLKYVFHFMDGGDEVELGVYQEIFDEALEDISTME